MLKPVLLPLLSVPILILGAIPYAAAQDSDWYLTGVIGSTRYRMNLDSQVRNSCAGHCDVESAALDGNNATAYHFGGGYRVNPYLAVELAYVDLGHSGSHYRVVSGGITADITSRYRLDGYQASLLGRWPVTERFAVLGKLGVFAARLRYSETGTEAFNPLPRSFTAPTDSSTKTAFGLGAEYRLDPRWSIRADWDRYQGIGRRFAFTESENGRFDSVDSFLLGVLYWF